jgi:hypothetical protein
VTVSSYSFDLFGKSSKGRLFFMDSFKWFPKGFCSWLLDRDKSQGVARVRENRSYAHEVASKLIEDKKKELEDGTSRKDLLSLLGAYFIPLQTPE